MEEHLEGKFTKYNNIFGDVERQPWTEEEKRHFDVAAAFSHFRYPQGKTLKVAFLLLIGVKATLCWACQPPR